jgi:hypothetical protein
MVFSLRKACKSSATAAAYYATGGCVIVADDVCNEDTGACSDLIR